MRDSMTSDEGEGPIPLAREAADLWLRVQADPGDETVRDQARRWRGQSAINERAFAAAEEAWRLTGEMEALAIPVRLRHRRDRQDRRRSRVRGLTAGLTGAAAAVGLALLVAPTLGLMWQSDYRTGTGVRRTVALRDGSSVTLDSGSAIALDYDDGHRGVRLLAGRAWFDVARDETRPFTVAVAEARVTVTGTAFDVGLEDDAIDVALARGGVRLEWEGSRPVLLTPGNRLRIGRPSYRAVRSEGAPSSMGSWRRGRLLLENVSLADGIAQLRRYYSGAIILTGPRLRERRVTGVFDVDNPGEALRLMVRQHGATVREVTPWLMIVSEN